MLSLKPPHLNRSLLLGAVFISVFGFLQLAANAEASSAAQSIEGNCKDGVRWVFDPGAKGAGAAQLQSCGAQSPTLPIFFKCSPNDSQVTVSVPMVQAVPRALQGSYPVSIYAQGSGMTAADGKKIPTQIRQFKAIHQRGSGNGILKFRIAEDDPLLQALAMGTDGFVSIIARNLGFHLKGAADVISAMRASCGLPPLDIAGAQTSAGAGTSASNAPKVLVEQLPADDSQVKESAAVIASSHACSDSDQSLQRVAQSLRIQAEPSRTSVLEIGGSTKVRWDLASAAERTCPGPLYLVVTMPARTRFEGKGFLALPSGAPGPFGIRHDIEKTRIFVPLHALKKGHGQFAVKSFEVGPLDISWALVQPASKVIKPSRIADFDDGVWLASTPVHMNAIARYSVGAPRIVIRDNFTLDRPKKVLRSSSGEFSAQIFDGFYRVLDARTGELVIERTGVDPNFSPGGRFIGAFVHAGNSSHMFAADIPAPNLEIIDLYTQTIQQANKSLFLGWGLGDAFYFPGQFPCVVNSCSAALTVRQALVDGPDINLEGLTEVYKSPPTAFKIALSLEAGVAATQGGRFSEGGWLSLYEPSTNGKLSEAGLGDAGLRREFRAASIDRDVTRSLLNPGESSKLPWTVQGRQIALSHHCVPDHKGRCHKSVRDDFVFKRLRINAAVQPLTDTPGAGRRLATESRLVALRSAVATTTLESGSKTAKRNELSQRFERLGQLLPDLTTGEIQTSTLVKVKGSWDGNLKTARRHIKRVKRAIGKKSKAAAKLLPNAKFGTRLDMETGGGCLPGPPVTIPFTHRINQMKTVSAGHHHAWMIHQRCTNGASGRYFLWLLAATKGTKPLLLDLTAQLRPQLGTTRSARTGGGKLIRPEADDWPQTIDEMTVQAGRYLVVHGTWSEGRWALAYDLEGRKIMTLVPSVKNADEFGSLRISENGQMLIQGNTNGQIFIYATRTGEAVLRGVETDDELIIYDRNGYFLSSPEGSQFLNIKFPGIPGYSSVAQFSSVLDRPDAIRTIASGGAPLQKPAFSSPPTLTTMIKIDGTGNSRRATLEYDTMSEVGLTELIVYVDGRPETRVPLSGTIATGGVEIELPTQARWYSTVATDKSGLKSVVQGGPLAGAGESGRNRLFAITVGTDTYEDAQIGNLDAAKSDAANFAKLLSKQKDRLYSDVALTSFLDERNLETKLNAQIRDIVARANKHDTIMLFAAGHGVRGEDGRFYLVTRDTELDNLERTAISWSEIAAAFSGVKARVVVFLDACQSGAAGRGTNDEAVAALLSRDAPITVIAASKGRQNSEETEKGGYFTNEIIRAVSRKRATTDRNRNGAIELAELYAAIKPRVVRATRDNSAPGTQTPWIARNQMVGEVPLF